MTLSRAGVASGGKNKGVQELWRQGGEGRVRAGGAQPWGRQHPELGALPAGCNKQLGDTSCFLTAGLT